jgi:hypothetical protein
MSCGQANLVQRMRERLVAPWVCCEDEASLQHGLAELERRVRVLRLLDDRFASVRLSEHIAGLRAASVPDRVGGVASPRMA